MSEAKLTLQSILEQISQIWNYTLVTVDQKPITFGKLLISFFILFIGIIVSQKVTKTASQRLNKRFHFDRSAAHAFENITFYLLVTFFTLFALKTANIPLTIFSVIGGAIAIGIGFGSQNVMSNFISGLIIMFERPIKIGDYIEIDNKFGRVEDIGMRSTKILSTGNKHMIIPNSKFLESRVDNWTHADDRIKSSVTVGVAYGSPVKKVREVLIQAVSEEPSVLSQFNSNVIFSSFGDSALIFKIYYFIKINEHLDEKIIASNLRFRINDLFEKNGIVIAFPQLDVHLHSDRKQQVGTFKEL